MASPQAIAARRARKTRAWQTARAECIRRSNGICSICHKPVDLNLPGTHPRGPTVDHRHPLSHGGALLDPTNLRLAHLRCNSAKKDKLTPSNQTRVASRNW